MIDYSSENQREPRRNRQRLVIFTDRFVNREETMKQPKKITSKQIAAIIGVALLVLLYAATLILAIADNSASGRFFMLSLACTLVVPIIVFLYCWMWARLTGKKTMGDPDPADLPDDSELP